MLVGTRTPKKQALSLADLIAQDVLRDVLSLSDDSLAKKLGSPRGPLCRGQKAKGSAKKRAHQRLIAQADQSICLYTSSS